MSARRERRASPSTASSVSRLAALRAPLERLARTRAAMSVKRARPARNASTAISLAALSDGRAPCRPRRAPRTRGARQGKRRRSGASNVERGRGARGRAARRRVSMRSGHASACAIGVRMSGCAELREHRAVDVLDQRVDDALRMDRRPRSPRRARRTASAPRSPRGPCSSSSPSRPRSCGPSTQFGCAHACSRRDARESTSSGACGTGRPTR